LNQFFSGTADAAPEKILKKIAAESPGVINKKGDGKESMSYCLTA